MSSVERLNVLIEAQNRASSEIKKLQKDIEGVKKTTESTNKSIRSSTSSMSSGFSQLRNTLVGLGIGYAIKGIATNIITLAGNLEQAEIAFSSMLGSAEQAKKLLVDLSEFAKRTPFELTGIRSTAKQLIAFGISADEMIPTLTMLGDVASGLSVPIEQVAYAYGQVRVANQLYGTELRQFMNAGIPILAELAKMFKTTEANAKDMVENGKIGFKDVEQAFKNMTGEGGKFHDMMANQSKTFVGKVSNMKDSLNKMQETIGMAVLPMLTKFVDYLLPIAENMGKVVVENTDMIESIGIFLADAFKSAGAFIKIFNEGINNTATVISAFVDGTLTARYRRKNEALSIFGSVGKALRTVGSGLPIIGPMVNALSIPGRATGGPVSSGSPYIVGEKGPELFVPKSAGNIVPNNKIGQSFVMNFGGVTIANGKDESYFKRLVEETVVSAVKNLSLGYT